MNEEQIKQNAEAYADQFVSRCFCREWNDVVLYFTAGAHSRDEEIGRMNTTIRLYANQIAQLRKEIEQLRNPWISVEKRLPENNCVVFVSLDGTEYLSAHYRAKSKRFVTVSKDKQTLVEVRKSAAIYTVCGDCIKEERLYSEGQREDITSLVTHWMPIPELKGGRGMKAEKAQTLEFDLSIARKCQTGEIKGYVYCGDGNVRHNLVSEIRDEGGGYYCAWFMSKVDGEYLQAFDEFGQIHNSKFRVLIEIYPKPQVLLIKPEVLRQMRKDLSAIMAEKKRNPVPSDQPADQTACEDFEPEELKKGE